MAERLVSRIEGLTGWDSAVYLGAPRKERRRVIPPGGYANTIYIFKNGVLVPDCAPGSTTADPDPSVSGRALAADVEIKVLSSVASNWNFGGGVVLGSGFHDAGVRKLDVGGRDLTLATDLKTDRQIRLWVQNRATLRR